MKVIVPWNDFDSLTGVSRRISISKAGSAMKAAKNSSSHETDLSGRGILVQFSRILTGNKSEILLNYIYRDNGRKAWNRINSCAI